MKTGVEITHAGPTDFPELLALYRKLYPYIGWSTAFMRWQYLENPLGAVRLWLARDSSKRIIATYAAIPHRVYAYGRVGIGWRVQDVVTEPGFRGHGIYNELSRQAAEFLFQTHFPINFTFPNEFSHNAFVRNGWQILMRIPLWQGGVKAVNTKENMSVMPIHDLAMLEDEQLEILSQHRKRYSIGVHKNLAWLEWRYFRNPRAQYTIFCLDKTVLVVAKIYQRDDGSRWAHLCDWFSSESAADVSQRVLIFLHGFAQERRCQYMSLWSAKHQGWDDTLRHYGLLSQDDLNRWMLVNINSEHGSESKRDWPLVMGDSDVY